MKVHYGDDIHLETPRRIRCSVAPAVDAFLSLSLEIYFYILYIHILDTYIHTYVELFSVGVFVSL